MSRRDPLNVTAVQVKAVTQIQQIDRRYIMRSWRTNDHEQRGRQVAAEEEHMHYQHSPFLNEPQNRVPAAARPRPKAEPAIDVKNMAGPKKWSLIIFALVVDALIIAAVVYYIFIR